MKKTKLNEKKKQESNILNPKKLFKRKRGMIKIIEAFISLFLIMGVILVILNNTTYNEEDISNDVYKIQISVLEEIQSEDSLREGILDTNPPVSYNDDEFPEKLKNKIENRIPEHLECEAKICELESKECFLDKNINKEIYSQPISISASLEKYSPKQLKLFCWIK